MVAFESVHDRFHGIEELDPVSVLGGDRMYQRIHIDVFNLNIFLDEFVDQFVGNRQAGGGRPRSSQDVHISRLAKSDSKAVERI